MPVINGRVSRWDCDGPQAGKKMQRKLLIMALPGAGKRTLANAFALLLNAGSI